MPRLHCFLFALALACGPERAAAAAPAPSSSPSPQQVEQFERQVRPVLIEHCFSCHGSKKQMGGLRLDSRRAALAGGDNGPALKPGDPDGSPLVRAIRRDGDLKMPPKKPLPPRAVEALTAWVKSGAVWPVTIVEGPADAGNRHWAFQPIRDPTPPRIKNYPWARTSIDPFVLARLEEVGLSPSPPADRRTLIRRVTFDLLGLPPSPEEVDAFVKDDSSDAYERLVERLLANPHYGERWGRHWLDVARYADTKGYVFFEEAGYPWAWTYRDYVIRAFNEDLPYDRFLLEQIAADQLPGASRQSLCALGFLTVGGRFMNNVHDILDDRIDVVCRGTMALTMACARCHDHKFDPIPTADYYSLYGVFASSVEPDVPPLFAPEPKTAAYEAFHKELDKREAKLRDYLQTKYRELTTGARTRVAEYLLAAHAMKDQPAIEDFMLLADGGDLSPFMLKRWQAYLAGTRRSHHPVFAPWHAFAALGEKDFAARARQLCAHLPAPVNPIVARSFADKPPATIQEVAHRYGELLGAADRQWQELLERASRTKSAVPHGLPEPAQEELRLVFWGPTSPPDVPYDLISSLDLLPDRASQGKMQELKKAVESWRATGPGAPPRAMVLVDAPVPYEPHVFLRGNPANLGPAVPRRLPALLGGADRRAFGRGSGRLEIAQAIVDPRNPLTARVLVNRIWLHHFGRGLVATPGDFGTRSDPPTHPELLDHLATTFVRGGWSIKQLHRRVLLSATYRQSSADRPDGRAVDPGNVRLWRTEPQRLDFEALRDALLIASGRLDHTVGGKSVTDVLSAQGRRRTLYGHLDRLNVPGLYRTFDFPTPDASAAQRDATTIPQQALFLLNHPLMLECSRAVTLSPAVAQQKELSSKVKALYRVLYGRLPTADELAIGLELIGPVGDEHSLLRLAQGLLMANEFAFVD